MAAFIDDPKLTPTTRCHPPYARSYAGGGRGIDSRRGFPRQGRFNSRRALTMVWPQRYCGSLNIFLERDQESSRGKVLRRGTIRHPAPSEGYLEAV